MLRVSMSGGSNGLFSDAIEHHKRLHVEFVSKTGTFQFGVCVAAVISPLHRNGMTG